MRTYVVLISFADQRVHNVKPIPGKIKDCTAEAEKFSIKVKDIYWTQGIYDAVAVADAPNDEAVKSWANSLGGIRTQIIPTYSAKERNERLAKSWLPTLSSCEIIQWSY